MSAGVVPIEWDSKSNQWFMYLGTFDKSTPLPFKGKIEPGETPAEAALRELHEESLGVFPIHSLPPVCDLVVETRDKTSQLWFVKVEPAHYISRFKMKKLAGGNAPDAADCIYRCPVHMHGLRSTTLGKRCMEHLAKLNGEPTQLFPECDTNLNWRR